MPSSVSIQPQTTLQPENKYCEQIQDAIQQHNTVASQEFRLHLDQITEVSNIPDALLDRIASMPLPLSATGKSVWMPNGGFDTHDNTTNQSSSFSETLTGQHMTSEWKKNTESKTLLEIGPGFGQFMRDQLQLNTNLKAIAVDMTPEALLGLSARLPAEPQSRLSILPMTIDPKSIEKLGDIIESKSVDSILLNRVTHFLDEDTLSKLLSFCTQKLKPGGHIYIQQLSPFNASYAEKVVEVDGRENTVEEHYASRDKTNSYPGQNIISWHDALPSQAYALPPHQYIHLISPDTFSKNLEALGFTIKHAGHSNAPRFDSAREAKGKNKTNTVVIASLSTETTERTGQI